VFPDAEVKVELTAADVVVRDPSAGTSQAGYKRRTGGPRRHHRTCASAITPRLDPPAATSSDAVLLDTTHLVIDEQVDF
jgi:cytidylate kinase